VYRPYEGNVASVARCRSKVSDDGGRTLCVVTKWFKGAWRYERIKVPKELEFNFPFAWKWGGMWEMRGPSRKPRAQISLEV
jgi:hypothetical protein